MSDSASRYRRIRLSAWAASISAFAIAVYLHLNVGLLRSQETLDEIDHSLSAYANVFLTPEALFLFVFGCVLSALAFSKGMHSLGDPYPGYGEMKQAVDQHLLDAEDLYHEARDGLNVRADEALSSVDEAETAYHKQRKPLLNAEADLSAAVMSYREESEAGEAELRKHAELVRTVGGTNADIPERLIKLNGGEHGFLKPVAKPAIPDFEAMREDVETMRAKALAKLDAQYLAQFGMSVEEGDDA